MTSARTLIVLFALVTGLALAGAPAAPAQDLGPLGPIEEPAPGPTQPEAVEDDDGFGGLEAALVLGAALLLIGAIAAYILRDARRRMPADARERAAAEAEEAPARARERERRKREQRAKGRRARAARRQNR